MSKHRKVHRDLEDLSKPSLMKTRGKVIKEFVEQPSDRKQEENLLEALDYIEDRLIEN